MSYVLDFIGKLKRYSSGIIFSQTATGSCSNTTSETTISSTGVGTLVLPANFFVAGRSIRLVAFGYGSSTANPTITIKIKFGSTAIATISGASGNGTDDTWKLDSVITCRTTGASGTLFTQAYFNEMHNSGLRKGSNNTATTTVDTTASQIISITAQFSAANASNYIHCTNLIVHALL